MLGLTAAAEVNGAKLKGIDLFLFDPHISIDASQDDLKELADKATSRGLLIGSLAAPVWPPTDGGSTMGDDGQQDNFIKQVRKSCRIGQILRELGVRPNGLVRIDSACGPSEWSADPVVSQNSIGL